MICFDTNIIIYIAKGDLSESIIGKQPIVYPSIVCLESLGYQDIRSAEEERVRSLLRTLVEIPLTDEVVERAIRLRQVKKMSLGDSIVAATALENNCRLWTANEEDFSHIDDLRLINPLKN